MRLTREGVLATAAAILLAAVLAPTALAQTPQPPVRKSCWDHSASARNAKIPGLANFASLAWTGALDHTCNVVSFHAGPKPRPVGVPVTTPVQWLYTARRWELRSGSPEDSAKITFASSATCAALVNVMTKLDALEAPQVAVPGVRRTDHLGIGLDGTTYELWTNKAYFTSQRVENNLQLTYYGWSDSPLDPFKTETLQALARCWSPSPPAAQ